MKMMKMMTMNAGSRPSSATHVSNTGARVSNPCMGVFNTRMDVFHTGVGVSDTLVVALTGAGGFPPSLGLSASLSLSLSLSRARACARFLSCLPSF